MFRDEIIVIWIKNDVSYVVKNVAQHAIQQ